MHRDNVMYVLMSLGVIGALAGCADDSAAPEASSNGATTSGATTGAATTGTGTGTGATASATTGAGGAGQGGAGGSGGSCAGAGGEGGAIDPVDPCATIVAPRVAWVTEVEPKITLTQEVELLWGFQFVIAVPDGEQAAYTLEHERCAKPAGEDEACDVIAIPLNDAACEVRFAPKYGVDPSQYHEGDNTYSFRMRLKQGCNVVSEDVMSIVLTYAPG